MTRLPEQQPLIIVNGGGYGNMIIDDVYKQVTNEAAKKGYAILKVCGYCW